MKPQLNEKDIARFEKDFESDRKLSVSQRTVTKNGIFQSAIDPEVLRKSEKTFSLELEAGTVTNQKRSGRCWMFAGLNVIRTITIAKLSVKNIEFSQTYLQFYDKLEKANFFLERTMELVGEDFNSRLNIYALDNLFMDGGHWAMFVNLVKKYGVVPLEAMPETLPSAETDELNRTLLALLSKDMAFLRKKAKEGEGIDHLRTYKEGMLREVYRVLAVSLGVPPTSFVYQGKDKKDKFFRLPKMTPLAFYQKYVGARLDDYISLSDARLPGWEEKKAYTSRYVNNVEGGEPVLFFNVPVEEMKKAVVKSLEGKEAVWFAADVLTQSLRKDGVLASGILRTDDLFDVTYSADKGERLTYRSSFCNHAMTFTGVNLDENHTPDRYKVENSWGKENGADGFFVMSDAWFSDYVYQILVNKKFVSPELWKAFKSAKPIEVSPFNAMFDELD
jgi:bleomycin hydrolase